MAHLFRTLTPFAPDTSGAVAALFELGGILVVCDAGGCTGNICGFDEPRWREKKCALFSAGLRDMDAILGRDDELIAKTKRVFQSYDAPFVAIIGTPVPAVIGTDFQGLSRLGEKRLGVPTLPIPTTGTRFYDEGMHMAYLAFAKRFLSKKEVIKGSMGVLGASPLDLGRTNSSPILAAFENCAQAPCLIGFGSSFHEFSMLPAMEKNYVISASGYPLALFLNEHFGTPYVIDYPLRSLDTIPEEAVFLSQEKKRILIVHEHVLATCLRDEIEKHAQNACIRVGTWFSEIASRKREGDLSFTKEEDFVAALEKENFDLIIADSHLSRLTRPKDAQWLDLPHFALSGRLFAQRTTVCEP